MTIQPAINTSVDIEYEESPGVWRPLLGAVVGLEDAIEYVNTLGPGFRIDPKVQQDIIALQESMSQQRVAAPPLPIGQKYVLRESRPVGYVELYVDGIRVFRNSEYRTVAEYAQRTYHLSDSELMNMYYDYKEDYDAL